MTQTKNSIVALLVALAVIVVGASVVVAQSALAQHDVGTAGHDKGNGKSKDNGDDAGGGDDAGDDGGKTTEEDVDSEIGGTVTSSDGDATLDVPADALENDTTISVTSENAKNIQDPSWGKIADKSAYNFGPDGTVFSAPATLSIVYEQKDLPKNFDESLLRVGYENDAGNIVGLDDCSVDTSANTVTCSVWHFTRFLIVAPSDTTPPAEPTDISLTSDDLIVGTLSWTNTTDADFSHIKIYESDDFGTLGTTLATEIVGTSYDVTFNDTGWTCFTVRAVDFAGNESTNTGQFCVLK